MKKEQPRGTSTPIAKERSRRRFRQTRWRPGLELLEVRQTPAVFAVNTALDTVAANLQTGKDAQGHISLRSAIMAANAQPGADTILLPTGFFRLTIAGTGEDAAARGDLDIRSDITIQGRGTSGTIIDGNGLDRVFDVLSGTVSISQLTIQDGRSTTGGGLLNEGGQVSLSAVVVQNNLAIGLDGAAGANGVSSGTPQNLIGKPGQDGGAASGGGIDNASGSLTLVDSTVSFNQALGGRGGRGGNGADLTGADGVPSPIVGMSDGQAAIGGDGGSGGRGGFAEGGGVFNAAGATLAVSGTTFANNLAAAGAGGAGGAGGNGVGGRGAGPFSTTPLTIGFGGNGRGGAGGAGGSAGLAEGGGLFNGGQVTLSGNPNSFLNDQALGGLGGSGGSGGAGAGGRGGDDLRASGLGGGSGAGGGGNGGDGARGRHRGSAAASTTRGSRS